jgi:hypothetical protein
MKLAAMHHPEAYTPECVEGKFYELRPYRVLGSTRVRSAAHSIYSKVFMPRIDQLNDPVFP